MLHIEHSGITMKILLCTTLSYEESADSCALQGSSLPFVKGIMTTIECRRARMDDNSPSALFYCDVEFVYVLRTILVTHTYALVIQTHLRPHMAARASIRSRCFYKRTMAL